MTGIETGVDRLVQLIQKEKKVALEDAAKALGVPNDVVREWADFLEEEGLISVQYSLSRMFLIERQLSKKEVEKKGREYENKREASTRKIDTTLKQLDRETTAFDEIKQQYYALKDEIGDEIRQVKDEVEELRHYEELKKSIDSDILQQKVQYENAIADIHRRLSNEEKRYSQVHDEIVKEDQKIIDEKKQLDGIRGEEHSLLKRIDALKEIISGIATQLTAQEQSMGVHEERLVMLKQLAESLEKDIRERREKELLPLVESSGRHQQKILNIQEEIIKKIQTRKQTIEKYQSQGEEVAKRFERFFEKKAQAEKLVLEYERQKNELKAELEELLRKAKSFDLASTTTSVTHHVKELEKQFSSFDEKRRSFSQNLLHLREMIVGAVAKDAPGEPHPASPLTAVDSEPAEPVERMSSHDKRHAPAEKCASARAPAKTIVVEKAVVEKSALVKKETVKKPVAEKPSRVSKGIRR